MGIRVMTNEEQKRADCYSETLDRALLFSSDIKLTEADFDNALYHIYKLLNNAVILYRHGCFDLPVFLAITAMEEKAKLEIIMYRHSSAKQKADNTVIQNKNKNNRNDPIYHHKIKHLLAPSPVLTFGKRLEEAIGKDTQQKLLERSYKKGFSSDRENSLYFRFSEHGDLIIPEGTISQEDSRNYLLFAIEIVDDGLVGYTKYSLNEISQKLDDLWNAISGGSSNDNNFVNKED